jgi:hypothetical protein
VVQRLAQIRSAAVPLSTQDKSPEQSGVVTVRFAWASIYGKRHVEIPRGVDLVELEGPVEEARAALGNLAPRILDREEHAAIRLRLRTTRPLRATGTVFVVEVDLYAAFGRDLPSHTSDLSATRKGPKGERSPLGLLLLVEVPQKRSVIEVVELFRSGLRPVPRLRCRADVDGNEKRRPGDSSESAVFTTSTLKGLGGFSRCSL